MLLVPNELRYSPIQGCGVYAKAPIKKGTLIWKVDPTFDKIIDTNQAFPTEVTRFLLVYGVAYRHADDEDFIYVDTDNARFMNHGDPCNVLPGEVIGEGIAVRDIAAGEELTVDYRTFGASVDWEVLHGFPIEGYPTFKALLQALKKKLRA
ncbi:MAG: SET domain-containing protein [Alphaproteobacteria bacterium]|nr:SET domain-containing protein [Alphaproteobacteria bacterium]